MELRSHGKPWVTRLIALKEFGDKGYSHIVLVEWCSIDSTNHIAEASILHARGGDVSENRKVRRNDLLTTYKKHKKGEKDGWYYKYLRFRQ